MLKVIILILIIFLGISLLPLKIHLRFYRKANELKLTVILKIWKIPFTFQLNNFVTKFFWNLSENKFWQKKPPSELKATKIAWNRFFLRTNYLHQILHATIQGTRKTLQKIAKPIIIRKIRLRSEVALENVAQTALAVGALWWFWGYFYSQITRYFKIPGNAPPKLSINPNYQKQNHFIVDFSCILEFPLGHIIIISYYLLANVKRIRRLFRRVKQ